MLPVATHLTGQYGIAGLYLSLPRILGRTGVERVLTPDLSGDERAALMVSAEAIRAASGGLGAQSIQVTN